MSYSKKRIEYNNKWPDKIIEFPAENEFKNLMSEKGIVNILRPIQLPIIEDTQFQRLLSFIIDIYDQLPNRPDIAFDLAWRTFEAYSFYFRKTGGWSSKKTHIVLDKVCEDILINQVNNSNELKNALENHLSAIPLQATEFLVKRIFQDDPDSLTSQQQRITERVKNSLGEDLFLEIETKYKPLTADSQRNCGLFLQILMSGIEVEINGNKYSVSLINRIKFLINGILYSYRNERFHGDAFSPFKSSQTKIKTFAHSYYCLLSTYFFICQLIHQHFSSEVDLTQVASTLEENTTRYKLIFGSHFKR